MGAGSPPGPAKPSAIPSHMLNGSSPLQSSTAAGGVTRVRDNRERESLNSSIRSSFAPRVPPEFESLEAGSHPVGEPTAASTAATEAGAAQTALSLRYIPFIS